MKFDRHANQNKLDLAADELEKAGFADLAEKVDYYSDRLLKATAGEIPLIKRALNRIHEEAKKRLHTVIADDSSERSNKAQSATLRARRSAEARKEILRRRLKTIVANRKKAAERLNLLNSTRKNRLQAKELRRKYRKQRILNKAD